MSINSLFVRFATTAPLALALCFVACDDKKDAATAPASSAATTAAATASATAEAKTDGDAVSCETLITQIIKLQDAAKEEGLINAKNKDKMIERCKKADNIKDTGDVVKCVMEAKEIDTMSKCENMGKLLGPW